MPPAVAVAGITAAGSLIGGGLQARSAGRAARYQRESQQEALNHQRERQRVEDQRYQQRWDAYRADRAAWDRQYGGGGGAPASGGGAPAAGGGGPQAAAATIGEMMGVTPQAAQEKASTEAPPETLGDWSDWRRYGIGA